MNFGNILIENYDLDELEALDNKEIEIFLTEISVGLKLLSFEKISENSCDVINRTNLQLLYNLGSEADNRNISTESYLIKSFLEKYRV